MSRKRKKRQKERIPDLDASTAIGSVANPGVPEPEGVAADQGAPAGTVPADESAALEGTVASDTGEGADEHEKE